MSTSARIFDAPSSEKRDDKMLLAWAAALIQKAQMDGRWGELVIQFKAGTIDNVREDFITRPPAPGRRLAETGGR
jgi:hypothetical protein